MHRIAKYLDKYAEREATLAAQLFRGCPRPLYRRALVIPAFDESGEFCARLAAHPQASGTLLIAVINRPCENSPDAAGKRTQSLWSDLVERSTPIAHNAHLLLRTFTESDQNLEMLLVDHCSGQRCLPGDQGVGLARKCGTDIALALVQNNQIASDWIYSTDADAWLPGNYFERRTECHDVAAIHCGFEHFNPAGTGTAQQLYDLGMHYYVGGLTYAGSPYAHYSLGSALIINAMHYAAVRGFPKRAAGEDFYLLNKLTKVGRIKHDMKITVQLEERESRRTPFGTGPAIRRIAGLDNPERDHAFYHPTGFEWLKLWLHTAATAESARAKIARVGALRWLQQLWQDQPHKVPVTTSLDTLGMTAFLDHALSKYPTRLQFLHQFHGHFDGLKTLRFIHALRDHSLGTVNAATARAWLTRIAAKRPEPEVPET